MNPARGSPARDIQEEEEEEAAQPRDLSTARAAKPPRNSSSGSSLAFSVESLISRKTTCRTAEPPGAGQGHLIHGKKRLSSGAPAEDSHQELSDKEPSSWFPAASLPITSPRKSPNLAPTLGNQRPQLDGGSVETQLHYGEIVFWCLRIFSMNLGKFAAAKAQFISINYGNAANTQIK